jgi:hypothetical protein
MENEPVVTTTIVTPPTGQAIAQAAGKAAAIAAATAGSGAVVTAKVVKPGWRSSELWVTVALPMACQYVTSLSHIAGPWGMLAGAVAAGLYSLARGLAKS